MSCLRRSQAVRIHQLGAVPMLFEDAPSAFDRVVFAVVWRVVEQLDRFADGVGELYHPVQTLRALCVALGAVVGLDLQQRTRLARSARLLFPPSVQVINDEVTGLGRIAERLSRKGSL
jgi:hypothetical protein